MLRFAAPLRVAILDIRLSKIFLPNPLVIMLESTIIRNGWEFKSRRVLKVSASTFRHEQVKTTTYTQQLTVHDDIHIIPNYFLEYKQPYVWV